ncbi:MULTISPECIES: rod shape-determining protein MreD [Lacticaseibacillus]|uniref:Rod shape-determining protein MreD n=1 Tax=Lacticaseibacillus hegangensis TaxID=2486010 RepID=A0ABW4CZ50_9LACO|nr:MULTISPECIES: rod shape-determining protein MreD [Lacticaseibacillus]
MLKDKKFTKHGWVLLLLLVTLLLDGVIAQVFAQFVMSPTFTGVPQLTLIALIMATLLLPEEEYIVAIAAVFGLIFDSYYTGMLGVNALLWPLLVYVVRQLGPVVPKSPFYIGALVVIVLTLFTLANYAVNRFLGFAQVTATTLIANHLGPSLIVNLVIFALAYLPLRQILINLRID